MAKKADKTGKSRKREMEAILSDYVVILNTVGAESPKELAYLRQYAGDAEALNLLRGTRAVKALFESFDHFPEDLVARRNDKPKETSKST